MGVRLVEHIFTALEAQTVAVPGTTAAETILPMPGVAGTRVVPVRPPEPGLLRPQESRRQETQRRSPCRRVEVLHAITRTPYRHKP
jgi:hypothetical protein